MEQPLILQNNSYALCKTIVCRPLNIFAHFTINMQKNLCTGSESQGLKLLHTPRPTTGFVATNEVLPHSVI